jgi:hypothetical protein
MFSSDLFFPNRNAFSYLKIILPIGQGPTEDLKQLGETATISARFPNQASWQNDNPQNCDY